LPDLKLLVVAPVVTRVASALAGAIDEIAIARLATKSNEAFIAMSGNVPADVELRGAALLALSR
jgi:hypothetical protein